jgi:hypothetical protein
VPPIRHTEKDFFSASLRAKMTSLFPQHTMQWFKRHCTCMVGSKERAFLVWQQSWRELPWWWKRFHVGSHANLNSTELARSTFGQLSTVHRKSCRMDILRDTDLKKWAWVWVFGINHLEQPLLRWNLESQHQNNEGLRPQKITCWNLESVIQNCNLWGKMESRAHFYNKLGVKNESVSPL